MKTIIVMLTLASSLWAFEYAEPEKVVELSQGPGHYGVGTTDEGVAVGPYRLIATDSVLYLLDQLHERVLCYDTAGGYLGEVRTPFRPADMALGAEGRIYLLENRTQPAEVAVIEDGKEVERMTIKYDPREPPTAIAADAQGRLLEISGQKLYSTAEGRAGGVLGCAPSAKGLRLVPMETPTIETAKGPDSGAMISVCVGMGSEGRTTTTLIAYDESRVWVGGEEYIQDKSGSFTRRYLRVYEDGKPIEMVGVDDNYYSYDTGWRNVSVDGTGNVYVFSSTSEGKASISRWRVNP